MAYAEKPFQDALRDNDNEDLSPEQKQAFELVASREGAKAGADYDEQINKKAEQKHDLLIEKATKLLTIAESYRHTLISGKGKFDNSKQLLKKVNDLLAEFGLSEIDKILQNPSLTSEELLKMVTTKCDSLKRGAEEVLTKKVDRANEPSCVEGEIITKIALGEIYILNNVW